MQKEIRSYNLWILVRRSDAVDGVWRADIPALEYFAQGRSLMDAIEAARETDIRLRIIGGTDDDWHLLKQRLDVSGVDWHERVPLRDVPEVIAGARAGLIPTNPDIGSGEFSCPMKLFDYTRCGLPVITSTLASLQSLNVGPWCTQVPSPTRISWMEEMKAFQYDPAIAESARAWAGEHTWARRADLLKQALDVKT